jgi:preprotein translocase subunit SecG
MQAVVLVLHLMIALGLVCVVLLQRSEGGALGIGGGGSGGFMTGRGTANLLTRVTAALAGLFFLTSITLTLLAKRGEVISPLDLPTSRPATPGTAPATKDGGLIDSLEKGRSTVPGAPEQRVPRSQ